MYYLSTIKRFLYPSTLYIIICIIVTFYGFKAINLHTADLGRHLKNGELVFENLNILKTNYYSYTNEQFSFINHHWLVGVIFIFFYKIGGFQILSLLYALIKGLSVSLVVWSFDMKSKIKTGLLLLFPLIPMLSHRHEIRPEGISFLFISAYIVVITLYRYKRLKIVQAALLLISVQIVWANTHIFFVFGPYLIGLLAIELMLKGNKSESIKIAIFSIFLYLLGVINPNHIYGLIEPFNIFRGYKYTIVENKDIFFIIKRLGGFVYIYTAFIAGSLLFKTIKTVRKTKTFLVDKFFEIAIFVTFLGLSIIMVRFISIFALVSIPLAHILFSNKISSWKKEVRIIACSSAFLFILIPNTPFSVFGNGFGVGLAPNTLAAADFYKQNELKGPIFNNYDNGGYLIFNLFPDEKVFIDNRPEAYPPYFIQDIYVKMQEDEEVWSRKSKEYGINTIFFYRHDLTPWAQTFLISRIRDEEWIPVYVDDYTLILVKNTEENSNIIKKNRLPNEIFSVTTN